MKYLFKNLLKINKGSKLYKNYLLMLDFDGTISPLASTPHEASLPETIKKQLKELSKYFPVAIISGRSLPDIKNKVGLKNLIYAGNHGLEWQIGGKINRFPVPNKTIKLLSSIKKSVDKIKGAYPGTLLEFKYSSLAIHYRQLSNKFIIKFNKDVNKIIKLSDPYNNLKILVGKKVIELVPNIDWNKGVFALFILKFLQKKLKHSLLPIYIGDDTTDEDVFKVLPAGLTIRIGYNRYSRAKYYIRNTGQSVLFMKWLANQHAIYA